ncbi:MAG TPA: WbqC family protein [Bacteroidales bacterium]|nr:WbqC family protein [Bacteroidales bacterium]HQG57182.1 WbqC family protein [Bacteroidales bacterium]HRT48820.1 WbqC family protein [Bacteroidales bacterium]HRU57894.1 WbqC family protein [Bacteroidales bacterium]
MKIAIQQSDYIPWKGYFDIIRAVDEFIIYDDVQYTRRDWRNRNRIKTPQGLLWLTIPVKVKGRYLQLINETEVTDSKWAVKHWKTICLNYSGTKYFEEYEPLFREAYHAAAEMKMLTEINLYFLKLINNILGINTRLTRSEDYNATGKGSDRILSLCLKAGARDHLTGPSAMSYIDKSAFERSGIKISVADYSGYQEYPQPWPPFSHNVSIIDLIFCTGRDAVRFMKRL